MRSISRNSEAGVLVYLRQNSRMTSQILRQVGWEHPSTPEPTANKGGGALDNEGNVACDRHRGCEILLWCIGTVKVTTFERFLGPQGLAIALDTECGPYSVCYPVYIAVDLVFHTVAQFY